MIINEPVQKSAVRFIDYTGEYPTLCEGTLTLAIDDEVVTFGNSKNAMYHKFWCSGGSGKLIREWIVDYNLLPDKYKKYVREIDEVINGSITYGCCGGCADWRKL